MEPGHSSTPPPRGNIPYPRSRGSIDGIMAPVARRPIAPLPAASRAPISSPASPPPTPAATMAPAPVFTPPQPSPVVPRTAPSGPIPVPQIPQQPQAPPPTAPPKPQKPSKAGRQRPRRKTILLSALILLLVVLAAASYGVWQWQALKNSPDRVFKEALQTSLSTSKVAVTSEGPRGKTAIQYDFSTAGAVTTSNKATIMQSGSSFTLAGYGSLKNTYVSYQALPTAISKPVQTAVTQSWVQLRANGVQGSGVPQALTKVADPRYQTTRLVPFANVSQKLQTQLLDYMASHAIYKYDKQVLKTTHDGQAVLAYSVTPNISYLKIVNLSIASNEGVPVADSQAAANQLDNLKGAKITLLASKKTHQFVGATIVSGAGTTQLAYDYNSVAVGDEPQTKLQWKDFASAQMQIESQAAARQSAADIDAARTTSLDTIHKAVAIYYAQNNSYPSIGNLNDPAWVAANLNGLDPDVLREPLATNALFMPAPKAGSYAYQTQSANPALACDNTPANQCLHYTLTALLHAGQPYSVKDP